MKSWSIKKQIIILVVFPVLFVGVGLAAYFTITQIQYIDSSLEKHAKSITKQVAPAAEYAVFSGNTKFIKPSLENILNDQDVIAVSIKDTSGNVIISLSDNDKIPHEHSLWRKLIKTRTLNFKMPIVSQEINIDNLNEQQTNSFNQQTTPNIIGYVNLKVTTYFSDNQKISSLEKAIFLTIAILTIGLILAIRVSREIATPVTLLTDTVRRIASGDFRTRITQDAPGELGVLESYVNSMAGELQSYREEMESRINEFTKELQQTLEELELRNAELDITRSNALAASRAKSEFLANMSHEIRTPLCGIMGFSELIDSTPLDEQQRDYINTIRKSADSLLSIIDDILDLSKIESGRLEISPVEFNILDVIEEVIDLLSPAAYEKGVELFYNLHKDTPRYIESDPVRIRQILINLIGNAVKFTDKGYVFLEVEPIYEPQQTSIRFTVTDTGIGMSQTSKRTLFQAFTQADTTITRRFGGTGLGLVISRKLVLLMNGSIDFDSIENEGSQFWFRIPVIVLHQSDKSQEPLSNLRILLRTDSELCFSSLRSMLEYWKCEVIRNDNDTEINDDIANIAITCLNFNGLSRLKNTNSTNELESNLPHLIFINSNRPEDIELVRKSNAGKVLSFSASQKQIYNSLCELNNSSIKLENNPTQHMPAKSANFSGVHVLVVDDNAINRRLAEIILEQHGAQVISARSGDAAIQLAEKYPFDIIFMDLHMPGLDGYTTTQRIRQLHNGSATVIIALTANAMPEEHLKALESGMNDIMLKPINENLMNQVISKWLNRAVVNTEPDKPVEVDSEIFSLHEAEKFTEGNTALAYELFNMLKSELPDYKKNIATALESRNLVELKMLVHKLHGSSRCCGTPALRNAAEHIEQVIDNKQYENLMTAASNLDYEIVRILNFSQTH